MLRWPSKRLQCLIPRQHVRVGILPHSLQREIPDNRELHHRTPQHGTHVTFAYTRVQISGLEFLQLAETFLRRGCPDSIEKFIDVNKRRLCGDRLIFAPSDCGPPGEITSKLVDGQVPVCRVITVQFAARPREIILEILHEDRLSAKVPRFHRHCFSAHIPDHAAHLANTLGDLIRRSVRTVEKRQGDVLVKHIPFRRRFVYYNRISAGFPPIYHPIWGVCPLPARGHATGLAVNDRFVEEFEHDVRFRAFIQCHPDPIRSTHPNWRRQIRFSRLVNGTYPAPDVATLDFRAGFHVPLPHQKRNPCSRPRMRQYGAVWKRLITAFFHNTILFFRISNKIGQFHRLLPYHSHQRPKGHLHQFSNFSPLILEK